MEAVTESLRQQFTFLTDSLNRVEIENYYIAMTLDWPFYFRFQILHNLLRSPDTKADILKWIVNCMRDNSGRKQVQDSFVSMLRYCTSLTCVLFVSRFSGCL